MNKTLLIISAGGGCLLAAWVAYEAATREATASFQRKYDNAVIEYGIATQELASVKSRAAMQSVEVLALQRKLDSERARWDADFRAEQARSKELAALYEGIIARKDSNYNYMVSLATELINRQSAAAAEAVQRSVTPTTLPNFDQSHPHGTELRRSNDLLEREILRRERKDLHDRIDYR